MQVKSAEAQASAPAQAASAPASAPATSNADAQQILQGPLARLFLRIAERDPNATSMAQGGFTPDQLGRYIKNRLGAFEGELFGGTKRDAMRDALFSSLDSDRNGVVTWPEFKTLGQQVGSLLDKGAGATGTTRSALIEAAHATADANADGVASHPEIATSMASAVAKSDAARGKTTPFRDAIADATSLLTIDLLDTDQRNAKNRDRSLTRAEWLEGIRALLSE